MKKLFLLIFSFIVGCDCLIGQQVNTLYFLENSPMRHIINPSFVPLSQGYLNFSPLGYMSLQIGNNSLTFSDIVMTKNGKTITALHPDYNRANLLKNFRKNTLIGSDISFSLFSFGFQYKRRGYIHIGWHERIETGMTIPRNVFNFLLDGGMKDINGVTTLNLKDMDGRLVAYSELYGGYSHRINERWIIGGKAKFLMGQAFINVDSKNLKLDISQREWYLRGEADINIAGPINKDNLPESINYAGLKNYKFNTLFDGVKTGDYLTPQGYGVSFDLGATYSPIKNLQISFAITDLGFLCWTNGTKYAMKADSSFTGVANAQFGNYYYKDNGSDKYTFHANEFIQDTLVEALKDFTNAFQSTKRNSKFSKMVSPKLIVGVDYNFCHDILNVGLVSKTRLFDNHLYEEVTIGGVVKPNRWVNFALSYSLLQNGEYSNIGAGISLIPYEGINITLAMDYIPLNYFKSSGVKIPYKTGNIDLLMSFSVVWGTNKKKDKDKDGVWDINDLDIKTPMGVGVDVLGCALDSDGDEIPDYLDSCPNTHYSKYGLIDSVGCPLLSPDGDGDGVPDDIDMCPNTPKASIGFVDEKGCSLDSDDDGIPDYMDKCPNTPIETVGIVDKKGCPLDSDGDGVPDYLDQCPNTSAEAIDFVDEEGCIRDTDGDSVPDYMDKCPFKPGPVENNGCPIPKKIIEEVVIGKSMPIRGVQFEMGSNDLTDSSFVVLQEWIDYLLYDTEVKLIIEGHTDNTGEWAYNIQLSEQRAYKVHEYFIQHGIAPDRLQVKGYGPAHPIASNATEAGREENRRVEFKVTKDNNNDTTGNNN